MFSTHKFCINRHAQYTSKINKIKSVNVGGCVILEITNWRSIYEHLLWEHRNLTMIDGL